MTAFLHMTARDLADWRALVKHARAAVKTPGGAGGDLRAAAKRAFRAVAPSIDVRDRIALPLRRLAEAWAGMDDATRAANRDTLGWLAEALAPLVGSPEPAPAPVRPAPVGRRPVDGAAGRLREPLRFVRLPEDMPGLNGDPRPEREPRRDIHG